MIEPKKDFSLKKTAEKIGIRTMYSPVIIAVFVADVIFRPSVCAIYAAATKTAMINDDLIVDRSTRKICFQ